MSVNIQTTYCTCGQNHTVLDIICQNCRKVVGAPHSDPHCFPDTILEHLDVACSLMASANAVAIIAGKVMLATATALLHKGYSPYESAKDIIALHGGDVNSVPYSPN